MGVAAVPLDETWKLSDIYPDDDAFETERGEVESALPALEQWRGRLDSAETLAEALEAVVDLHERLARLRCYAGLKSDENVRDSRYQAMRQSLEVLATDLGGKTAYLRPEILAIEPARLEGFLAQEPRLSPHAFFLRDLSRQRAHVLGPREERILSESGLLTSTASSLYELLNAAELPRPQFDAGEGEPVPLTPVNFQRYRTSPDRELRLGLFPAYFAAYRSFRDTLGLNLYATVKSHMFRARSRAYPSCLDAALDGDNVPRAVYETLIRQVRARLPVIQRYFRLRARALGIEQLEYPDLYCSLSRAAPNRYRPAEAQALVAESLRPLGQVYGNALSDAFAGRWIDWHPAPAKRSGAYASGWAYRVHPYVLLNFTGDYESVSTLAHEMGHAMHSYFSNRTQPFATADYSIFVAEVASTVNEMLLARRMLATVTDHQQRLFLLGTLLDGIRGTLFRQTMFAEFELTIHEAAERGEALTGERLSGIYLELLRHYHGHDDGVAKIADDYAIEWAAVPHFHYNFYVYQYSTGIVAAMALSEALDGGNEAACARYLEFLHAGGSDYPLELLRGAGVDLESAAPYDAAFRAIDKHLDDLETQLDDRESRSKR